MLVGSRLVQTNGADRSGSGNLPETGISRGWQ